MHLLDLPDDNNVSQDGYAEFIYDEVIHYELLYNQLVSLISFYSYYILSEQDKTYPLSSTPDFKLSLNCVKRLLCSDSFQDLAFGFKKAHSSCIVFRVIISHDIFIMCIYRFHLCMRNTWNKDK